MDDIAKVLNDLAVLFQLVSINVSLDAIKKLLESR
jgi:hypothetical protein